MDILVRFNTRDMIQYITNNSAYKVDDIAKLLLIEADDIKRARRDPIRYELPNKDRLITLFKIIYKSRYQRR